MKALQARLTAAYERSNWHRLAIVLGVTAINAPVLYLLQVLALNVYLSTVLMFAWFVLLSGTAAWLTTGPDRNG